MAKLEQKFVFKKYKYGLTGFLFIVPALILLIIFVYIPLVMAIYRSFFDYKVYAEFQEFVKFDNYKYILSGGLFMRSLWNVSKFSLIITFSMMFLSFAFAHALKALTGKLGSSTKTIIYLPSLVAGITVSMMFSLLIRQSGGLLNAIAAMFDVMPIDYGSHEVWSKVIIIVPTLWMGFGYNSLVMYAALINIPKTYYEAAKLDGANWHQRLFRITIPNMRNYFLLLVVGMLCGNLQMFDLPFILTGGGPRESTYTPVMLLFNTYKDNLSIAFAGAIILMLIITTANSLVFFSLPSKKSEDA